MQRTKKLSDQVEEKTSRGKSPAESKSYDGSERVVSTGSTLLDLAISGGRFLRGGIPFGIMVEVFGPPGAGKTVLLCQLAGNVQKLGSKVNFYDPEARLNKQFARMFGLDTNVIGYDNPDTVTEVFRGVRDWADVKANRGCGVFTDSLAALSTNLEMDKDEGDKMGMRRAKEFSEELRKTCRILTNNDILMVCSNQIRQNSDAGPYGQKYISPGGEAIGFYSSLRLRCSTPSKIKSKLKIKGKEHERVVGVKTEIEVFKSSIWKPYRKAEVYILFDYGIDDIRGNLRFLKTARGDSVYKVGGEKLSNSLEESILIVEEDELEEVLKEEVIDHWNELERHFKVKRKPRM